MHGQMGLFEVTRTAVPQSTWTKVANKNDNRRLLWIDVQETGYDIYFQIQEATPTGTDSAILLQDGERVEFPIDRVPIGSVWAYQSSYAGSAYVKVAEGQ